jgi:hypothetical protein
MFFWKRFAGWAERFCAVGGVSGAQAPAVIANDVRWLRRIVEVAK